MHGLILLGREKTVTSETINWPWPLILIDAHFKGVAVGVCFLHDLIGQSPFLLIHSSRRL